MKCTCINIKCTFNYQRYEMTHQKIKKSSQYETCTGAIFSCKHALRKISAFNENFPTEAPTPEKWSPKKKFQGAHESPKHSSWASQAFKLVTWVHLVNQSNYFSKQVLVFCKHTDVTVLCWLLNLVTLALGGKKNPHIVCLWNP